MIRKADLQDIIAINEIYNQAVRMGFQTADTEAVSLRERQKWFKEHCDDSYPVFVYVSNDQVVGWVSLSVYRKGRKALRFTAEVSYYIHQEWQKKGIGSQLLIYAIDRALELGYKNLFAILLEPNIGSIRLLEKHRFVKWGELPRVADFDGQEFNHLYYGLRIQS
ncbi:N-acetyltransferase [Marinilabiliaceae bacterium JC017]|nr:N-acetyltransferase [Marinilabiliaceae bacterium JC017]